MIELFYYVNRWDMLRMVFLCGAGFRHASLIGFIFLICIKECNIRTF